MSELRPALTREQVQAAFRAMDDAKDYLEASDTAYVEVRIIKALQQSMDDIESALWSLESRIISGATRNE